MGGQDQEHLFGGEWTDLKLKAVAEYLQFYTSALKNKPSTSSPFQLWYIDAFAGSGQRTAIIETGGLDSGLPIGREKVQLEGSARRALKVHPPFRHLVFIEKNARRHRALQALAREFPARDIRPIRSDANEELAGLFSTAPWVGRDRGLQRAVVFLDPYGIGVKWKTFQLLAATERVDVWYLFPLQAVLRQLAHDLDAVDSAKQASLDEIFGRSDWRADLYRARRCEPDLFGYQRGGRERAMEAREVEAYFQTRLRTIFPFVSDPVPLVTTRRLQSFSLFCACANPSPVAQQLIRKGVDHVIRKYSPASRRMSDL